MSLILYRHKPVEHPYYIDVLGIHIHSSQELCYVIRNHPIFVMGDLMDELLIEFIRRELDMDYLAGGMEKLIETGSRSGDVLMLFLSECDYYSDEKIQKLRQTVAALRALRPVEYEKERVDYMFRARQYGKTAQRYTRALEYPKDKKVDDLFLARVCNNLGTSYATMLQFRKALASYDKAHDLGKDLDVLEQIYFLSVFSPELDVKGHYQSIFAEELRSRRKKEMDAAGLDAGQDEEVRALRTLFKKDPIKRINGATQMVQRWKQEYRMMI